MAEEEFDLDAFNAEMTSQMKSLGFDASREAGPDVNVELDALMRTQSGTMDMELAALFAEENPTIEEKPKAAPVQPAKQVPVQAKPAVDTHDEDAEDFGEFTWEEVEMIWDPASMESYEVLEWAVDELTKMAETDEDASDDLGGVQLRLQILASAIQSESLTKEAYEQKVKNRMNRDRNLSQWFADRGRMEEAAIVLKRSRVAQGELRAGSDAHAGPARPSDPREALQSSTKDLAPVLKEITAEEKEKAKEIAEPLDEIAASYREAAGKWMEVHKAASGRAAQETQKERKIAVSKFSKECLAQMAAMVEIAEKAGEMKERVLNSAPDEAKAIMASAPKKMSADILIGMSESERQLRLQQHLKTFEEEEAIWKQTAVTCLRNGDKEKGAEYNKIRQQCQFWQQWLKKALEDPLQPLPIVQDEVITTLREKSFDDIPPKTIRLQLSPIPGCPALSTNCVFHVDFGISSQDFPNIGKGDIQVTRGEEWIGDFDLSELKDAVITRRVARGRLNLELEQLRSIAWMGMKQPKQLGSSRSKLKTELLLNQCEFSDTLMIVKDGDRKSDIQVNCVVKMRTPAQTKEMIEEHVTHPMVYLLPPSLSTVTIKSDHLDALPRSQTQEIEVAPAPVFNGRPPLDQQLKDPTSPLLMNSIEALEVTFPVLEKMGMLKRAAQLKAKQARLTSAIEEGRVSLEDYVMKMKEDEAADQLLANELKRQKRMNEGVIVLKRIKAMKEAIQQAS